MSGGEQTGHASPACAAAAVVRAIFEESRDVDLPDTKDILACGPATFALWSQATRDCHSLSRTEGDIAEEDRHCSADRTSAVLQTLLTLASDHINAVPYDQVRNRWLRLYTDASILCSALDIILGRPLIAATVAQIWNRSVRRLDLALIVAGAVGVRRAEWCQRLIKALQAMRPNTKLGSSAETAMRKRKRPVSHEKPTDELLFAPNPISRLTAPPSIARYLSEHVHRPFILRGFLSSPDSPTPSWPAVKLWNSAEYLIKLVGEGRVVPVEVGGAYIDADWGQRIMPFGAFLRRAGYAVEEDGVDRDLEDARPLYLAQHPLLTQMPELASDISLPDYVWAAPPAPSHKPDYRPPETDNGVAINVWVGSGGGEIVSPAHTDPYYNCYAQVVGRKRVWIAPPSVSDLMVVYGGTAQPSSQASDLAHEYMSNTSSVPILRHGHSLTSMRKTHSKFVEYVLPHSQEAILQPGDMMVMPPGWWHAMRAEGDGPVWSVSMWY